MDKEKKNAAEKKFEKSVNEAALKAYSLKKEQNSAYKTYQNNLFTLLINHAKNYKKSLKILDQDDIRSCADEVMFECLCKWEPGRAEFWTFYKDRLNKRIISEIEKNKDTSERIAQKRRKKFIKEHPELTAEEIDNCKSEIIREAFFADENEDDPDKDYAGNENTENDAIQSDIIKSYFDVLNNFVLMQKKKYENSTKPCYAAYFYTEFVTRRIEEENNKSVFNKAESGLMKVIDHDFVSYYMIGDNSSVAGIAQGKLKKVSAFTKDPSDDRPCGYDIENIVYAKYISALKKRDKIQSDSSISQQRTKFTQLIQLETKKSFNNE